MRLRQQLNPGLLTGPPDNWPPPVPGALLLPTIVRVTHGSSTAIGGLQLRTRGCRCWGGLPPVDSVISDVSPLNKKTFRSKVPQVFLVTSL